METYIREQIGYCIGKINEYANTMGDEPTSMWYYWNGQLADSLDETASSSAVCPVKKGSRPSETDGRPGKEGV